MKRRIDICSDSIRQVGRVVDKGEGGLDGLGEK